MRNIHVSSLAIVLLSTFAINIVVGIILVSFIMFFMIKYYNNAVHLKNDVLARKSNIDTQLEKRKYVLSSIHNVADVSYEKEQIFANIILDSRAVQFGSKYDEFATSMCAVSEDNPEAKFLESYKILCDKIAGVENAIQDSREKYNTAVASYNSFISMFPNNILLAPFSFRVDRFAEMALPELYSGGGENREHQNPCGAALEQAKGSRLRICCIERQPVSG